MSRSKVETLKIIFTSEYWLIASLCGAFFVFFALNRGGVVVFIEASLVLLVINIVDNFNTLFGQLRRLFAIRNLL